MVYETADYASARLSKSNLPSILVHAPPTFSPVRSEAVEANFELLF